MGNQPIKNICDLDCYLVGGAVRDKLLNIKGSDRDWVVVGATEKIMLALGFRSIGKDFPVYLHPRSKEEYALARTELKVGKGYKGFAVDTSKRVTLEQDLYRRDLTINAMALDADENLIDPYGGRKDLENGLLRHVSEHFIEDPLRVLRVARFAARYHERGFIIDDSTLELMCELSASGELTHLVAQRVWQEVISALNEANPAVFFQTLKLCGALEVLLPEVDLVFTERNRSAAAMAGLTMSAGITNDGLVRFAVLAYFVSQPRADSERSADGSQLVDSLCDRLKAPGRFRKTAVQISRYADQVMALRTTSAADTVELIIALNGLRDKAAFEQFLAICQVVLAVAYRNERAVNDAIELMRRCRDSMYKTDAKGLAKQFRGQELRKKVRAAYIAQVSQLLEQPAPTGKSE